jgi:hypothetical protein
MIRVKPYLKLLRELEITQAQYLLLHCLYYRLYPELTEYKNIFPATDGTIIGKVWFDDLVSKGLITRREVQENKPTDFIITEKFTKYFVDDVIAFEELKAVYPAYMKSQGRTIPLLTGDEDELTKVYYEKINGLVEEHKKVLEDIAYMVEKDKVTVGLEKFIKSKGWEPLRREKDKVQKSVTRKQL